METAARIARLEPVAPPYSPDVEAELTRWMPPDSGLDPLQLFRTLALNLGLMERMLPLGSKLLNHGSVAPRDREIVVQRTCALAGAEAEWATHVFAFAKPVGISTEQVASLLYGSPDDPCWSPSDALLVRLSDALHAEATIDDQLRAELAETFTPEQVIELLVIAGWYRTMSYVVNGAGVACEPYLPRFTDIALP